MISPPPNVPDRPRFRATSGTRAPATTPRYWKASSDLFTRACSRDPKFRRPNRCSTSAAVPDSRREYFSQKIPVVAGIDATPAFIEIARERLPGRDFRVAEMETLPHADASFDVITGFNAFQYAASPQAALVEARRVARAGGAIVVATWGLPEDCDAAGHLKALGALMPPPPPGAPGPFALSDASKLKALVSEAGLIPGAVTDVDCPWAFPNLETALRGMLSSGPAERAIRNSTMARARDAVAESIATYRTPSGEYRLNNKFRYLIARR